jgi:hypothetical protein
MDEINQMMIFQNMDETTFLNEKYCHPYVNVCECDIHTYFSRNLPLILGIQIYVDHEA